MSLPQLLDELTLALQALHLLRPLWLLLLLPIIGLWWVNRRAATRRDTPLDGLAPHLRMALTVGEQRRRRFLPIDGVAAVLILATLGAAGPTWTRQVDPFMAQTGPLVVVLKVTPSMNTSDVAPSRLERAKQKIRDLLDLRAGARTALVAYAGTAHRVLPFTEDAGIIVPYLEGLDPSIMPKEGADVAGALATARGLLDEEQSLGGILFVMDGLSPADADTLSGADGPARSVLAMLPAGTRDQGLDRLSGVPVVPVSPDGSDIERLDRILNTDYRRALLNNEAQPWEDRAWWLAVPAALFGLLWFRRGWSMRWGVVLLAVGLNTGVPAPTYAAGLGHWFLTPDQQGWLAYRSHDYPRAAELFEDPLLKGHALFRAGRYEAAIEVLRPIETSEAAFVLGLAQIRNRQYRAALSTFEDLVERDPEFPGAARNLELARQLVEYVEAAREASDTGEEQGIGADDVVYDNEAGRGSESRAERKPRGDSGPLTAEQWMSTVDTRTGDFLRIRFQLEAARKEP